ncbi:uncharacterized protein G2W53_035717 [Senna tora]|uniref:Uncharacterized protein n=1 Tax=Senna tora TaxID=362788 RepID=A0A834SS95_9FABA|nr:uncharacterized protein G2W53_035717 [Senna tora]
MDSDGQVNTIEEIKGGLGKAMIRRLKFYLDVEGFIL